MKTTSSPKAALSAAKPPTAAALPQPVSIHMRAFITWLAIFPLVAIGMMVTAPLIEGLHPVLRALVLTLLVVPAAVYLVVPRFLAAHGALMRRRTSRR